MKNKPIILSLALWLVPSLSAFAQETTFTRIITGAIVTDGGSSRGGSWGDYNNDGDLDLFVTNAAGQNNFLYQNNGNGTFTKITSGAIVTDGGDSRGSSWGDYDNDGDFDLFVANRGGENNFLYQNNGNGTFTKITTGAIVTDGGDSRGCSWGDYDNDGDLDLFVANSGGQNNFLYQNNGNSTFTKITSGAIATDGGYSFGSSWGDYDNDGDLDLFVANLGESNFLYQNNGNGTFTKITSGAIVNDGGNSHGSSWGDYDNDGDLDLFVANAGQNSFLYQNNGNGTFTKITSGAIVNDVGSSYGSSWGDYDNDGDLDLFVANFGENNFLYQNNGDGTFTSGAIVNDGGNSYGGSWGDYDNDGDLDLFVANGSNQNNFLYQNNGNGNNRIDIRLLGTVSNTAAIGAKVKVKATINGKPAWQMQEISGQTGFESQNSLNAEFGLGDATIIDSIKVEWPSGFVQDTAKVNVNRFLTIKEKRPAVFCKANFTADRTEGAAPLTVGFTDRSVAMPPITSWRWDFDNDGTIDSQEQNPSHIYTELGNYSVRLIVSNGLKADTLIRGDFITVPQFTKITSGAIVNDGGRSIGSSWGDYDNDGDLDIFVANLGNNFLYQSNGNGTFTKITSGPIVTDGGSFHGSWGDYDNDGELDLFVANSGQNNFLYQNNGNGSFIKITSGAIVNDGGYSHGSSWGDYDNDGDLDLFVANTNDQNNFLYQNNGDGTFTKITSGAIVNDGGNSEGGSWGDYDNDGDLDLFVANTNDQNNFLYQNNGNGTFTKITSGAIVNDGGNSEGGSWGDYDNDGDLDLFVANTNDQNNFLYQNNGDGTFTKITSGAIVNDGGNSEGGSWGDYDNDGDLDLFVANTNDQNNFLYQNNGDGTFTKITSGPIVTDGRYSRGCGWGDYDNDGDLDLFVANDNNQNNFLYQNHGNGNNRIDIRLVGTVSNTVAIGAKVKVKATINGKPVWQMQEISGQTGFASQNSLNAEFGLGDATIIDSIKIEWPSRIVQDRANVAVNQFLIITETEFTRVTNGAIVTDGGDSFGSSWGDYDNDGDLDLFVANSSLQNNFLYQNNDNGTFTKITGGPIVNDGGFSYGSSWGDYDNDGDLDLFVANCCGQNNFLYQNNGNGTFTKITTGAIVNDGGDSRGSSWGDYDNDGDLDLFVTNSSLQNNFLYQNNGNGTFTKITNDVIVNDSGNSQGGSWGDYDNDGDLDLFVANSGQNNFLYQNNGNGTFTKITSGPIVNDGGFSYGGSWGDYDNDGDLDLFVANFSGQNNFFYQNNGNGAFTKITSGAIVNDGGHSSGSSWGDYDNDGDLDLFVANYFNENNFLYRNNGDGTFTKITSGAIVNDGGDSQSSSWGDYDNDGDLDLFVANANYQNSFLYQNNGNSNNRINIRLLGTVSNTSAIGAKVRIKARIKGTSVWQMREISGTSDGFNQNSLNAEFGLGRATIIDSIRIEWPSKTVNFLTNIRANQFLELRENNRPRIENKIPDITLSKDVSHFVRDLNAVFTDRDGDALTYTALSQNPLAVTASISGSLLTISLASDTARTSEHTKITVTADDGGVDDGRGNPKETSFAVNRSPYVLEKIADIKLLRSDKFVKDLKKVFKDPDGDNVSYSAGSSDTLVALAAFSESKLVVVPFALGNSVITVTADDGSGGKTAIQFGVAVITSPAPEIRHENVTLTKLGEAIPITAQINDDENAVALAVLQYRAAGALGFIPLSMDTLLGKFHSTIPVSAVTDRGVEYYIAAKDIHNVPARLPAATGVFSVRVRVDAGVTNKRPQPSGGEQKSYHLFSIPLDADKKKPSEVLVLENNLGPYNIKKWRFYDIATDTATGVVSNIQFPNTGEMALGKAFWLIVKASDRFINTGPGTTVLTSEPFAIALKKGWNFVGNPFNFPAFAEDALSNGQPARLLAYEAGDWSDPIKPTEREFQPFEGYAVYCSTACQMFINPNRFSSFGKALAKTETSSDEDVFWSIRILAQCQEARDGNNLAAIVKAASRELDRLDQPEPPVIGEYVSVYFPHREWNTLAKTYCLDARPEPVEGEGEVWEFEVKTNIRDKVNLTFEGISEVPKELEVWLVDDALQITQNLRESNRYAVAGSEQPKPLKLVVGKHEFVGEKLAEAQAIPTTYELSQNFPNPFNPATTIRYGLPQAERVTLKVYNLLGEEVALIMNDELRAAGYHAAIWDGRDKNGKVVASGVYVYRIRAGSVVMMKKLALVK